jgi:hypothetical protein
MRIRRNDYTVVGLTRRMVSSGGDPMVFIPIKDAQQAQFLKDNDAIVQPRERTAQNPALQPARRARPAGRGHRIAEFQQLGQCRAGADRTRRRSATRWPSRSGAGSACRSTPARRWRTILIGKLIATAARQIGMFLVILAIVSAAIVAFIIYTLTMDKIREIAVLKLIGTRNRTIASMILQQALALGLIGFASARSAPPSGRRIFPKYVLLEPQDSRYGDSARCWSSARSPASSPSAWRCGSTRRKRSEVEHVASDRGIRIEGLRKRYGQRRHRGRRAQERQHGRRAGRSGRADRSLGFGQEHLAEMPGRGDRPHRRRMTWARR